MIKGINGSGHIVVTGGASSGPHVSNYSNNSMVGMVRYHNNNLEVYDGMTWLAIQCSYATVDLSGTANAAIAWAMSKMAEDAQLEKMAADHPAVKAAYENLKRASEQLKATIILSKDEESTS
jgi:hypothetical protein